MEITLAGITKSNAVTTLNPKAMTNGWEFDLRTEVSLSAFHLKPASALLGTIRVDDKVEIEAHVRVVKSERNK